MVNEFILDKRSNTFIYTSIACFFAIALFAMLKSYSIADFGNYYYGSKLFFEGRFNLEFYKDIALFNNEIRLYGEKNYFENCIPVPPFSLFFYLPFIFFKPIISKLFFSVLGLLFFSFSFKRLCNYLNFRSWQLLLIPICVFYPLYNNGFQGQTYVLITALLIEVFLLSEKQKDIWASLFLAITICLKLFPVFFLLYFIIQKQYRVVIYTLFFFVAIYFITSLFIGSDVVFYYFKEIVPRLANNDIVGTYYHGNQSIYTLLLNLFSYDGLENTEPIIDSAYLVIGIEAFSITMALIFLFYFPKVNRVLFFSMVAFSYVIISRYNTSYSMLMLLPLLLSLIKEKKYAIVILIALAISLPIGYLKDSFFILQYSRIIILLMVFILLWQYYRIKIKLSVLLFLFCVVVSFKYASYSIKPANYFSIQNSKGMLYDYQLKNDSIILRSTMGYKNIDERFYLKTKPSANKYLTLNGNLLYYKNKLIDSSNDNKQNPFVLNDSTVIFMSDLNQGIRFYKLRVVTIK